MEFTIHKSPGDIVFVIGISTRDLDMSLPLKCAVNRGEDKLLFESKTGRFHDGFGEYFTITPTLRDVLGWLLEEDSTWWRPGSVPPLEETPSP